MPSALASGTDTIFDWNMNVTPPKDYAEWGQLVEAFARHILDRYGLEEIRSWYFEVWNEPNLSGFWTGSKEDYWKLYEASACALKKVDSGLRVGGPASSKANWITDIITHCHQNQISLDFVSTHLYPQDEYVDYKDRQGSPHEIGRFFSDTVRRVQSEVRQSSMPDLEIHWTEWNTLSTGSSARISWTDNSAVDSLLAAALICDICTDLDDAADTLCWWVASDVFEESGLPQSEFSCTYGLTTLHGLPKASYHAFEFLNRLRGPRLSLESDLPMPLGCGAVATQEGDSLQILLWHRQVLELQNPSDWNLNLHLPPLPSPSIMLESRIQAGAGSAWETWRELGSPQTLSPLEMRLIRSHAQPAMRLTSPGTTNTFSLKPGEVLHLEIRPQGSPALPKSNLRHALADWEQRMSGKSK
ncbi:MAG: hypothetical protein HC904_06110 [Blastochloris sp.]|nr:hypothetical protein [Blastochloris sp.]